MAISETSQQWVNLVGVALVCTDSPWFLLSFPAPVYPPALILSTTANPVIWALLWLSVDYLYSVHPKRPTPPTPYTLACWRAGGSGKLCTPQWEDPGSHHCPEGLTGAKLGKDRDAVSEKCPVQGGLSYSLWLTWSWPILGWSSIPTSHLQDVGAV